MITDNHLDNYTIEDMKKLLKKYEGYTLTEHTIQKILGELK